MSVFAVSRCRVDRLCKMYRVQDMNDIPLSLISTMKPVFRPFMTELQINHPESLRVVYLLNIPSFFSLIFAIISKVLKKQSFY